MKTIARLENRSQPFWAAMGLVLIAAVGILDLLTGYELSFSLFYLLPISAVVWFAGKGLGVAASIVSAIVWLLADILSGQQYSQPLMFVWNAAIRLGFFVVVTLLLAEVRTLLEHEKNLSRTDYVTGAVSAGYFYVLLQSEVDRSARYRRPFTVAYVDIDDFKAVNDKFGHSMGDQVLRSVVTHLKTRLRKTDVVARLGGDELAMLLPETDQTSAPVLISKIQEELMGEMRKRGWPVTFSIGTITFMAAPTTTDEVVRLTDELMYEVKRNGKNAIRYSVYTT